MTTCPVLSGLPHLITAIHLAEQAKTSLFFTVYRYRPARTGHPRDPKRYIAAVYNALERGVKVTAIIERGNGGDRRFVTNHRLALDLRRAGATVIVPPRTRVVHAKVFVADNFQLLITSGNLTLGSAVRNIEYGALIQDKKLATAARMEITKKALAHG